MRLGVPSSSSPSVLSTSPRQRGKNKDTKNWNGKIIGICDIEETLWEPRLGIKGMVDVSVEVVDDHGNTKVRIYSSLEILHFYYTYFR